MSKKGHTTMQLQKIKGTEIFDFFLLRSLILGTRIILSKAGKINREERRIG